MPRLKVHGSIRPGVRGGKPFRIDRLERRVKPPERLSSELDDAGNLRLERQVRSVDNHGVLGLAKVAT